MRLPYYGIVAGVVYTTYVLKRFRYPRIVLIISLVVMLVSSSIVYVTYSPEEEYWNGYDWLLANTNIYVDEKAMSSHYSKYMNARYRPFAYDVKGYYHLTEFQRIYRMKFGDVVYVRVITNANYEIAPLVTIYNKSIYFEDIKWSPYKVKKLSNCIYKNDIISFCKIIKD